MNDRKEIRKAVDELLNRYAIVDVLAEIGRTLIQPGGDSEYEVMVGKLLKVITDSNWPPSC